jgi:hypothetical protein
VGAKTAPSRIDDRPRIDQQLYDDVVDELVVSTFWQLVNLTCLLVLSLSYTPIFSSDDRESPSLVLISKQLVQDVQ